MAYWHYLDTEAKSILVICDFADLAAAPAKRARARLCNAYGDEPDFEDMSAEEINLWCDDHGIGFEPETGFPRWSDAADSVLQLHYPHPDSGEEMFTFADLPDDGAREEATVWLWEEQMFSEVWDDINPRTIPLNIARDVANHYEILFDCSGVIGVSRAECASPETY